ncbi:MAG: efflux RND transporter periplasmic adaptor subunit [Alphaproteobacteria bacterium]|nr:efflux RND transporter periplasmic adaptor subunit [Alphaproteobacteria bacterium]
MRRDARSRRATYGVAILTAALTVLAGPAALAQTANPDALVKVDRVTEEPFTASAPVIGRVVAREAGVVTARVAATVVEMRAHEGDRVAKGGVLAVLDGQRLEAERDRKQAELDRAEAQLNTTRARLRKAENELDRMVQLRDSSAFQKSVLEDRTEEVEAIKSEVTVAHADIAKARAELRLAEIDVERTRVRAPYDGVVTLRSTAAGEYMHVGDPVVTMVNDQDLELEADVSVEQIAGLERGVAVTFTLADGSVHSAVVRAIVPDENPMTRTRAVRFTPDFSAGERAYAINQSATVQIPLGKPRRVVSVHKDAVINAAQGRMVFVVGDDKAAQPRPVQLGRAVGSRFEVLGGLAPGEIVVIRGNERLLPGQKVRYEEQL